MRKPGLFLLLTLAACGSDSDTAGPAPVDAGGIDASGSDAGALDSAIDTGDTSVVLDAALEDVATGDAGDADALLDASLDAQIDDAATDAAADAAPDAATCPTVLLQGGSDVTAQGWTATNNAPTTLSYGADYVRIETSTATDSFVGGQNLLYLPNAVQSGLPFKLEFVVQVESVNPHSQFDSAAAILGSFSAPHGSSRQRALMVYLDSASVGWADDTQSAAVSVVDGQYHTYVLEMDAEGAAHFWRDGVKVLTRVDFETNGTIAIGDQTNDPNVDAALRIRSVTKLCL